jgi:tRNA-binding EMAP/Myf-like protein
MSENGEGIEEEQQQYITFEEFSKVRLKIGKVIRSETMPGMKKVFKATIDLGTEQREIAVGGLCTTSQKNLLIGSWLFALIWSQKK